MKLLILYTKNPDEVFNRKSAIGSYINCLADLINDNSNTVFLNGEELGSIHNVNSEPSIKGKLNWVKRIIPSVVKRYVKDKKHLKALVSFEDKLNVSSQKYDAVLEFYNIGSKVGLSISQKQKIPLYITYDGPIVEEYTFFNKAKPFFLDIILDRQYKSLRHATKVVTYSNPMKLFVNEITNNLDAISIHQNVDFTRLDILKKDKKINKDCINICFIGSFLKWHNVEFLVNSFEQLRLNNLDVKLYLIGDGVERKKIQSQVEKLPHYVNSKIVFTEFLDGEELFKIKQRMDIGVMPGSNWYGAPNKIFEYGAMEMAVIAPDTPTIVDLFTDDEVLFFEWKNEKALNESLFKLVKNKQFRIDLANSLHKQVITKYTESNTKSFYNNILKL